MRYAVALVFLAALCVVSAKTPPAKVQSKTNTTASARKSAHHRRTKVARRHAAPRPSYQLHPDPERYQQIQQALVEKGYFKGEPNGRWNDDSVEALKHFQTDRNLPVQDGKINSLTLIGLGLGPKHDGSTSPN
jgi:hypothetical protein